MAIKTLQKISPTELHNIIRLAIDQTPKAHDALRIIIQSEDGKAAYDLYAKKKKEGKMIKKRGTEPLRPFEPHSISWKDINGHRRDIYIEDEIRLVPSNNPNKVVCLQKLVFPKERKKVELRLCYYTIGVKGRAKGKWVFGQFATLIPAKDFKKLFMMAKRKGWI